MCTDISSDGDPNVTVLFVSLPERFNIRMFRICAYIYIYKIYYIFTYMLKYKTKSNMISRY